MIDYCNRLPFTVSLQNTRSQTRNDLNLFFVSIEGFPIFHMFPCVWNIRHHPSLQPFMFVNTWSHAVWGHQASRCLEDGVLGEGTAMLGALVVWLHHGDENGEPLWTRLQWSFPNMNNLTSCLGALRKRSMRIQVDQVDSFTQRLMKPHVTSPWILWKIGCPCSVSMSISLPPVHWLWSKMVMSYSKPCQEDTGSHGMHSIPMKSPTQKAWFNTKKHPTLTCSGPHEKVCQKIWYLRIQLKERNHILNNIEIWWHTHVFCLYNY